MKWAKSQGDCLRLRLVFIDEFVDGDIPEIMAVF